MAFSDKKVTKPYPRVFGRYAQDHESDARALREKHPVKGPGRRTGRPNYLAREPEIALSKTGHQADISKKAEPGGQDVEFSNVPSPPRRDSSIGSLMVDDLSLSDRSKLSAVSQKRCAEGPSQVPKRQRHSGGGPGELPRNHRQVQATTLPLKSSTSPGRVPPWQHTDSNSSVGAMPVEDDCGEGDTSLLLEPQTRPITQEQLINEVKGIYAGLVMVEKKCVEITQQRSKLGERLKNDQWQALIALHRTLLHEHHDFFLASQHPTASPALKRLANKYAMPARMWRHGIHSFLELLRQQLPESLDHMLSFVYIAYSMMALLKESVPSFVETWIECLGDLARYRMAIEDNDMYDRDIWSKVARTWYNEAADRSPNVGRIQHHLAVLARPNIVQQLFLYSKALVSIVPFVNARDSIMLLFTPLLENPDRSSERYPTMEASFVTGYAHLFTRSSLSLYRRQAEAFLANLDGHIGRSSNKWKIQGPEVAASLIAGIVDFGKDDNPVWMMYQDYMNITKERRTSTDPADVTHPDAEDTQLRERLRDEFWARQDIHALQRAPSRIEGDERLISSVSVTVLSAELFASAIRINANKIGDKNIVPFMSFVLSFLLSLAYVGAPLIYLEPHIPWYSIVTFLNTLGRSGVSDSRTEAEAFPIASSGTGRQLPEDFLARGAFWAQHLFPPDFFKPQNLTDEDERHLELASHTTPRSERCLFMGIRLASFRRHIHYDTLTKQFSVTEYASSMQEAGKIDSALPSYLPHPLHHNINAQSANQTSIRTDSTSMGTQTLGARTASTDPDYVIVDNVQTLQAPEDQIMNEN